MTGRPDDAIAAAFEATWPPAGIIRHGGIATGRGLGAGGRVSSSTVLGPWTSADLDAAIAQHDLWHQPALFRAWDDDTVLIDALSRRRFRSHTPTLVMAAGMTGLTDRPVPPVTAFAIWPPLAIQRRIWQAGSITPARQAVMDRVPGPKAALLGRLRDRAAGAGFVAVHGPVAMIHAVEVLPAFRGQGLAGWMLRHAAFWSQDHGAARMALAVGQGNLAAQASYRRAGFTVVGRYAYWGR